MAARLHLRMASVPRNSRRVCALVILLASLFIPSRLCAASAASAAIDFQRDVRPILSGHCFKCHGPDDAARKAGLRLDSREAATRPAKSGDTAVVPGQPERSELIRRIFTDDPNDLMPPPEAKHPLSFAQKEILKRWIAAGAEYTAHWAFIPPQQAPLPKVKQSQWPRNEIDYFTLARMEAAGLRPSPRADAHTLVRRLYLDLIGLPPTPEEVDEFVFDNTSGAYEKLVDKLLASPHYGERWARRWLDLARYADTNGYEKDRRRSIWPYRDWVIRAFNADMPFDQFTIEQIAGDLLPDASVDHRIATGFHRNTMLNEEGGIDPLEFRYYAVVDRVNTTATAWLGLTMACAQCHTHKFDPIQHSEYYKFMAFLNNAEEPEIEVPDPEIAEKRAVIEKKIASLEAALPDRFPVDLFRWHTVSPRAASAKGSAVETLDDSSVRFSGASPDKDVYTLEFESELASVDALQVEMLPGSASDDGSISRGQTKEAILSELRIAAAPRNGSAEFVSIKIAGIEAAGFTRNQTSRAIDGKSDTGWTVRKLPELEAVVASARFKKPVQFDGGARWRIELEQQGGKQQTFARLRMKLGTPLEDDRPLAVRRKEQLERRFEAWRQRMRERVVPWSPLRPAEAKSNLPLLTVQEDNSIFVSGDQTKSDTYELKFRNVPAGITALRVEALPDARLPKHGPGRVYYEGPIGDFTLSEFSLVRNEAPAVFQGASHSFASGQFTAAAAIDGNPQTGWSIHGGQGRAHSAVFVLESPLDASEFTIRMLFERHFAAGLGRFRISATTSARRAEALDLSPEIEKLLGRDVAALGVEERRRLLEYYLSVAPELADARQELANLRSQLPAFPTTLVMTERSPENPRATSVHKRGEFLQPAETVQPDVPAVLHPFPEGAPRNRLGFARWLVDQRNPLVGRVAMNREWAAFFGTGLVKTIQDFGFQGELPSHPELLDWLAVEFMKQGWSMKKMHRLIVASATYQQSSKVTPELLEKDPQNRLVARGPRVRLEAELIRDLALQAGGLLSPKIGGPSVFPPQPANITTEGAYGPLEWKTSEGADRYRRGLYTFAKRTAPYATLVTFDAPTGEACVARREVSNTPLQSLTLLNDSVFVEAAQALGRWAAEKDLPEEARVTWLFRRVLARPPDAHERKMLIEFYRAQKERFLTNELDASAIAGGSGGSTIERAAWTAVARAILNLDETITKT